MTISDEFVLALTVWRENCGGGYEGMQSVANVVMNRATKNGSSPYRECVKPLQFSSITAKGGVELTLWPAESDSTWITAQGIASAAISGSLSDKTGGATLYYAPAGIANSSMTFTRPDGSIIPTWPEGWDQAAVVWTASIASQEFFKEV